ncbi:hypothetical protein [Streptomyces anandii]|uniref:hypothetical protein n=1 Tax=Streptomyces anandii TaxID=285454 RepID=UPI0037A96218
MRVKGLIQSVNPVPPPAADQDLSARAEGELAALVGPEGPVVGAGSASAPGRSSRRGVLLAAVACGAVLAVGGGFLGLHGGSPAGSGSHRASGPGIGPGGSAMADEPSYGSTAELEGAASLIVRARVGEGHQESVEGVDTTVATAKVVAGAKGAIPGDSVEVAYTTPGTGPETTSFTSGKEYVLLLDKGPGGRFVLVNTTQGWYEVRGNAPVAGKDNHVGLSADVRKALGLRPR